MTRTYSPQEIAQTLSGLLAPHLVNTAAPAFYLWARSDRAVISVNPGNVKSADRVLSDQFVHHFSTILGGVPVVKTNTRGIFYQVGYQPRPPARYEFTPLNLAEQPGALHLPIGMTPQGKMWLPLGDIGSALIGGTRRMGKTRFVHGWIQALINGGEAELVLYDGKKGLEFARYANEPGVTYTDELLPQINRLFEMANKRRDTLQLVNATSLVEYNQRVPSAQRLSPVVLVVDEIVTLSADEIDALGRLIAWSGAYGVHPICATQRTGVNEIPAIIKTNMATRICFPVPGSNDSLVVLNRTGAEKLPKTPGRLLFVWEGKLIQAQAFQVELPGTPQITGRDLDLARWAVEQHNGRMSISLLVQEQGMGEWDAREILDVWQSRGWLLGGGQGVARRVSPGLLDLISQSLKVPSKSQSSLKVDLEE